MADRRDRVFVIEGIKGEFYEVISNIKKKLIGMDRGHYAGASPVITLQGDRKNIDAAARDIEIRSEESFLVRLVKDDETVEVLVANRVEVSTGKEGYDVALYFGEELLTRLRKRPDLLSSEWDMLIDESVEVLMNNPIYQGDLNEGENPLYEAERSGNFDGFSEGGVRINFSERTSPCFCTRG